MKNIQRLCIVAFLVVLIFNGCEAGLSSDDSSDSLDNKFSFSDMYIRIKNLERMLPPIGAIVAWHKNLTGMPDLPDNFVECNGSEILDSDSPLFGQHSPNLNGSIKSWNSKGSFLRGGSSSGEFQNDAFQGHNVQLNGSHSWAVNEGWYAPLQGSYIHGDHYNSSFEEGKLLPDGSNGDLRTASETRPVNMSVVWIMRIK